MVFSNWITPQFYYYRDIDIMIKIPEPLRKKYDPAKYLKSEKTENHIRTASITLL